MQDAARYLRMPAATLRTWVLGRSFTSGGVARRSDPLIELHDPSGTYLSFINLVEAHVLVSIRRRYGVKLPKVRLALNYVKSMAARSVSTDTQRPLIEQAFETDGLDLFVRQYGELINTSRNGQVAMKELMSTYLQRIERDEKGLPIRLYPVTRSREIEEHTKRDPRVVVISPLVAFGRPTIDGTGIPSSAIFERYQAGDSVSDLARDFRLEPGVVEEAIRSEAA